MAVTRGRPRKQMEETIGTDRHSYAEAITSAHSMGLDLETWTADAIAFHVYRCECMGVQEAYAAAEAEARANSMPTPDASKFRPQRPQPTVTQPKAGQGSRASAGRSYTP